VRYLTLAEGDLLLHDEGCLLQRSQLRVAHDDGHGVHDVVDAILDVFADTEGLHDRP